MTVLLGLIVALHAVSCASNFSRTVPLNVGVNVHFKKPWNPSTYSLLTDMGVRTARLDLTWDQIETKKGVYDFVSTGFDEFVHDMGSHNITPYFIFDYGNPLYDGNLAPHTEEGRAAFAAYALACVDRYQGRDIIFEIWNEPNGGFWRPKPNVQDYCSLAHTVIDTIRAKHPDEYIVGPTTSGIDMTFLEEVFKCGLLTKFSAISVHPYGNTPPELAVSSYIDLSMLMAKYGGKDIDVLSGEWGFSDIDPNVQSEEKQAKYLSRQWAVNSLSNIPVSIWYDFHDDCTDSKNPECHFGTVTNGDYKPKPSHYAAKTFTTLLGGYTFESRQETGVHEDFILVFRQGKKAATLVWSLDDVGSIISVQVGSGSCVSLFDYLGNEMVHRVWADKWGFVDIPKSDGIVYAMDCFR